MNEKTLNRARRRSSTVSNGQKILDFMASDPARARLVEAAQRGLMPLTAISGKLRELLSPEELANASVRQFCGLAARAILEEEGFVIAKAGVRVRNDPVFSAGSVYVRRPAASPLSGSLLQRFIDALSQDELAWAEGYIKQRLANETDNHANEGENDVA